MVLISWAHEPIIFYYRTVYTAYCLFDSVASSCSVYITSIWIIPNVLSVESFLLFVEGDGFFVSG